MAVTAVVTAAALSTAGALVQANQAKQQEKGAANAAKDEQTALNEQITGQQNKDKAALNQQQQQGASTQKNALAAIRAAMSASASSGGTILGGAGTPTAAPIQSKTLLGA